MEDKLLKQALSSLVILPPHLKEGTFCRKEWWEKEADRFVKIICVFLIITNSLTDLAKGKNKILLKV